MNQAAQIEDMLRQAVPDLAGLPLYVCLASDGVPETLRGWMGGYAGPQTDLVVRDWLGGRYLGRGPAMVIDDLKARDVARIEDLPSLEGAIVRANAIHEMAHLVDMGFDLTNDVTTAAIQAREIAETTRLCASKPQLAAPFLCHTATWIRVALHLVHRVRQQGLHVDAGSVFLSDYYQVSPHDAYREALGDEFDRLGAATFAEIMRTPPPADFQDLWNQDVMDWLTSLGPEPGNESLRIAAESVAVFPQRLHAAASLPTEPSSLRLRTFTVRGDTFDEASRSVEAVLCTETPTTVFDMRSWEAVDEVLLMDGCQLEEQVVLVDSHPQVRNGSIISADVHGSVRNIRTQGTQLAGRLFFASDPASQALWGKVRDKHIRDLSVGAQPIEQVEISPRASAEVNGKTYRARERRMFITTKWRLGEVSVTPRGADPKAKIRQAV